ncbi:mandelate racemase [Verminephrobacter aporrectodeae subsp. tuberculatae]|uniref:mandelate racemase/muconate lactonizing enzyme family protein n=1 Tax=Verminephrobacter aporrectodeae TaxID=1110389 RepID=UPI0022381AA2|nr:mandelate racemase/muconate lactonizing enzyme family protein [Verminephrobacter aporrectodeae]MCW5223394.1 mandelate racemase [Verminephrobacter aporrectodeae subsp. tuberculatae]MCW5288858.1 mandelate racemase [Verminephrobacter aporrectodeae subsp. tuberculatae]
MKITRIDVYHFDLSYVHGVYTMSGGRNVSTLASTLVRVVADDGLEGWGEVCPLGSTYLPAHAGGARAALQLLAPALIGVDPTDLSAVNDAMDAALVGYAYAKSPLDVACWDLTGKAWGVSVATLLGGVRQDRFPLYFAVPLGSPEEMTQYVLARRAQGIHRFQLKVGGDPTLDGMRAQQIIAATGPEDLVVADANCGWRLNDALIAARAMEGLPRLYLEQPCPTMEECIEVRKHSTLPMVYDEVVNDVPTLIRAVREGGAGAMNLKVSKVGGLTQAKLMRDLCQELGVQVTIEDTWGGDVVSAASAHLAASTRARSLLTVSFMNDWTREHVAGYQPRSQDGSGSAPTGPGLGIDVDPSRLAAPLFSAGA